MKLVTTSSPDKYLDDEIINQVRKHNGKFTPDDFKPLSIYIHDDNGSLVGGMTAFLSWNYLEIKYLWVNESSRGLGYAAKILHEAETFAQDNNCEFSLVDTYEFQALEFYQKQGYEQIAEIDGYVNKYKRYFLQKKLKRQ